MLQASCIQLGKFLRNSAENDLALLLKPSTFQTDLSQIPQVVLHYVPCCHTENP